MINYTEYDPETNRVEIDLDTGGKCSVAYCDIEQVNCFNFYGLNCDIELPATSDDLKDIIVKIGGDYYTALEVVQWYDKNLIDIARGAA